MQEFPKLLQDKLEARRIENSLRSLQVADCLNVDLYSNDYLGFAKSVSIAEMTSNILLEYNVQNGSTGSRLISGTHPLHLEVEQEIADFHSAESGLLYNSGYDANVGLFSAILQKNDVIIFDELIHASVRDGIRLSPSKNYKFKHNNLADLEAKIIRLKTDNMDLYIAIESVYSMDGDTAPLKGLVSLCQKYNAYLIVDEAHSGGVFGVKGKGLVCELELESRVFARVHTFGKALGCHGAVVLGSNQLRNYLINFSRSFIYTTAIPIHTVATIKASYQELEKGNAVTQLQKKIDYFKSLLVKFNLEDKFIKSSSAIHCCIVPGNDHVKKVEVALKLKNIMVKAVLSPTVPKGKERIRMCLHLFNSNEEILFFVQEIIHLNIC